MRAIIVSVDYADILAVTLPYNRHHFDAVTVVTTAADTQTIAIAEAADCHIVTTELFYAGGAAFNKYAALEYALDQAGRQGWLCLLDADILFPKVLPQSAWVCGNIYSPKRRMQPNIAAPILPEWEWAGFAYGEPKNNHLFAGYTQIFHAEDPVLSGRPWHKTHYDNASDGDTDFSRKWAKNKKIRPAFDVLHLGLDTTNWCGRAAPYKDGTVHQDAVERVRGVQEFLQQRSQKKRKSK